jgi:hypothetical protein
MPRDRQAAHRRMWLFFQGERIFRARMETSLSQRCQFQSTVFPRLQFTAILMMRENSLEYSEGIIISRGTSLAPGQPNKQ